LKPAYEVADIIHQHGQAFLHQHPQSTQVLRTLDAIAKCRTKALGGHVAQCNNCGHVHHYYNSCRNRHCPSPRWIDQI